MYYKAGYLLNARFGKFQPVYYGMSYLLNTVRAASFGSCIRDKLLAACAIGGKLLSSDVYEIGYLLQIVSEGRLRVQRVAVGGCNTQRATCWTSHSKR